jgi:hypothetical protein
MQYVFNQHGEVIDVRDINGEEPVVSRAPGEIVEMLTDAEYTVIWQASQQSPQLARWLDMLRTNPTIRADDPRTIAGCQAAVQGGLLTAVRVLALFGVTVDA